MGTLSQIIPYSADADLSQHFNDDFNSMLNALKHSCDGLLLDIYPPDIHNPYPIGIPLILFYQMKKVSKIIERGITAVVENYFTDRRLHESFLRLSEHARWLLKLVESQPYKIGSWRPDILFPDECSDKFVVCEINARFPFNGFYASHAKNSAITELPHLANVPIMPVSELEGIPEAFSGVFDSTKCIGILKSTTPDRGWDVNLFRNSMSGKRKRNKESSNNLQGDLVDIANSDASVPSFLDPPNISRHLSETFQCDGGARFVDPWDLHVGADGKLYDSIGGPIEQFALEISQKELLDMPRDVIRILLTECRYINDIRTILLTHDKRMLSVLTSPEVMKDYMSPSDMQVLQNYIIQTYVCGCQEHSDVILEASRHRSEWILKPNSGGKGVGIVFGRDCSDSKWREMLGDANFAQYVLQRVIKQKVFSIYTGPTQISGDNSSVENGFKDMLLVGLWHCFNDKFLGPGIFRASSLDHPIVNVAGGNGLIFSPVVLSCKWPLKRNIPLVHENGNADRGGVPEPSLMFTPPPHCVFKLRTRNGVNSLLHGAGGERSCEFGSIINALEEDGIALVHTDWLAGYRDSDLQLHSEIIDSQLLELVKKLGGVPNPHTDGGVGGGTSVWNVQPICSNPSKLSGPRPARSLTAEPFGIHTVCAIHLPYYALLHALKIKCSRTCWLCKEL